MKMSLCSLICFLLLCAMTGAQDQESASDPEDVAAEVNRAFDSGDYRQSIDGLLKLKSHPDAEEIVDNVLYGIGCCYTMLGEADKAFAYLDSAIHAGYLNYYQMSRDSNLVFLMENHRESFDRILTRAQAASRQEIARSTPVVVLEYDNYTGPLDVAEYVWGDIDRPEMDTLRQEFKLRDVIGAGGSEFEQMKRLLNWVSNRWVHDGNNIALERSALPILRRAQNGERFCCANYADVLRDCLCALGYPTRFVGLSREDVAYATGGGHGCVETWSNQFQKWILLDAQNNGWWVEDSVPLSAYECQRIYLSTRGQNLKLIGQHTQDYYAETRDVWVAYFYRVHPGWMGQQWQLITDGITPLLVFQKIARNYGITHAPDILYPQLNRTNIHLRHDREDAFDSLTVTLGHTMPFFDRFLLRIDDGDWQLAQDSLMWVLKEGENKLEARAVNAAGVEGKPSRVVLRYNPRALEFWGN